jgi:ABC-type transport system involved in cytochrome c biogenesis permease subunit
MTMPPRGYPRPVRVPLHFWAVGLVLVLWNCWCLLGAIAAQVHLFPEMPEQAIAYLDHQPLWFIVVSDLSPLAGAAGALALLVQSHWAPRLFLIQIGVLVLANAYEVIIGTSPLLDVPETRASTAFLLLVLAAQTAYALRMAKRGLLG